MSMPLTFVRPWLPTLAVVLWACDSQIAGGDPAASTGTDGSPSTADEATGDTPEGFFADEELETILAWLGPLPASPPADPSNAYADDPAAAALGQKLFFDPGYSSSGEISCATCHNPTTAFDDDRANTSEGLAFTSRSSMSLLNGAYAEAAEESAPWQFWDGRADSQWAQALGPPESAVEMGSARSDVVAHVHARYRSEYEEVFGPIPTVVDAAGAPLAPAGSKPGTPAWDALPQGVRDAYNQVYVNFGKAIAAYERRLVSRNSRFDAFWAEISAGAKDSDALTDEEKAGLRVFIGPGRCLGCHGGPNFTDGQFHNTGVSQVGHNVPEEDLGRASGLQAVLQDQFNCASKWSDHPDKSLCNVSGIADVPGELGAFKTPSLRDIANRAPYLHTGTASSLAEVIQHYDVGGGALGTFMGTRDELVRPLGLSLPSRQALIAFLVSLSGEPLAPELTREPSE